MTKLISLPQGLSALVDDEDYDLVQDFHWYLVKGANTFYAARNRIKPTTMHGLITRWPMVDHRDGNGLDNRRENLRKATHAQNHANSRKRNGTSSPYKGVSWNAKGNNWMASIRTAGKTMYLGLYIDQIEAAKAYDRAARNIHGEFCRVNFPEEGELSCLV